jgi:hypothetical protein
MVTASASCRGAASVLQRSLSLWRIICAAQGSVSISVDI